MENVNRGAEIRQYLTFGIDREIYGVDVLKVREVLEFGAITRIPKSPPYMVGVINLRGHVVPIIDLRLKFDMPTVEKTVDTSIIIVEVEYEGQVIEVGALVDTVKQVVNLDSTQLEAPPKIGMNIKTDFISSMGKTEDSFIIILNTDRVFTGGELMSIKDSVSDTSELVTIDAEE
ncbi:MAG: chemotaxis protein CheW [Brevinematales bacterium]|nr:chemotaxis protein CheW [Brevinematales bacterium]